MGHYDEYREKDDREHAEWLANIRESKVDRMMKTIGTNDSLIRKLLIEIDKEYDK